MLDHMLITRNLLAYYRGSEIHNEILHDESAASAHFSPSPELADTSGCIPSREMVRRGAALAPELTLQK
jgi:hypothetical protein